MSLFGFHKKLPIDVINLKYYIKCKIRVSISGT